MENSEKIQMIEISKIFVLNPRERNELIRREICENIETIGLKRPITVRKKESIVDGFEYDLVCGQGRLEAFKANNQKEIPAIVLETSEENALIMSLVENIARRNYHPCELLKGVKRLKECGYSSEEIAQKTGLTKDYISQIICLLERGEDKLLDAVERKKIPLNTAIDIAYSSDSEIQSILQEAYEKNILRGKKLQYVHQLIESRKKSGKELRSHGGNKRTTSKDLQRLFEMQVDKKKLLIRKANKVENFLIITTQCFKRLCGDENFKNLLKAENLNVFPKYLSERLEKDGQET